MPIYRKKPIEVEVSEPWTGDNLAALETFAPSCLRFLGLDDKMTLQVWNKLETCYVTVPIGHRLIRGVKKEYYPIDPEVLDATYDDLGLDKRASADE